MNLSGRIGNVIRAKGGLSHHPADAAGHGTATTRQAAATHVGVDAIMQAWDVA